MTSGVIRSLTRQWVPHPFHPVTVIFSFQALSWFPLSSICRSQNAASQDVIKFKMAPRGKLKTENGRYKYPFFFLFVSLLFQLDTKNWNLTLMLTVERGLPKQPARTNREVSLCSCCFSSAFPFKRQGRSQPKDQAYRFLF